MPKRRKESVVGAVFSATKSEVLLVKRRDVPLWVLPGGGIEEGESPEVALLREIAEESGYQVSIERKVGEYLPLNRLATFTHLFACTVSSGSAQISAENARSCLFFFRFSPSPPSPLSRMD